jgi:hypothetical protein
LIDDLQFNGEHSIILRKLRTKRKTTASFYIVGGVHPPLPPQKAEIP